MTIKITPTAFAEIENPEFVRVSLIVGEYVVPNNHQAIERAKNALMSDMETTTRAGDYQNYLKIKSDPNASAHDVPSWLAEDLEAIDGWGIE
jgi:hypothetical protein